MRWENQIRDIALETVPVSVLRCVCPPSGMPVLYVCLSSLMYVCLYYDVLVSVLWCTCV